MPVQIRFFPCPPPGEERDEASQFFAPEAQNPSISSLVAKALMALLRHQPAAAHQEIARGFSGFFSRKSPLLSPFVPAPLPPPPYTNQQAAL
jgi:hypothetical protein